ncbi:hypothetical protein H4R34_003264 [Dimargaris verticillata]|uniref:Radical S-adenosyl methionine domain-containing protein 1, mitochondrial n=1 Tax=Dimargaris verticillata TaxID=2761393 RepID=A0A9W8B781_9FUNG|nr:hypothetical protein H4R34_003264 [Dimargaris verticillata]
MTRFGALPRPSNVLSWGPKIGPTGSLPRPLVPYQAYTTKASKALPAAQPTPLTVYVHWPYCESKCTYCNFNKYVDPHPPVDRLADCLVTELRTSLAAHPGRPVQSVYFGGGTPSLAPPNVIERLLTTIATMNPFDRSQAEVTLEANPTSLELGKMRAFKHLGVNRLSLGIQTLDPSALQLLGRNHSVADALRALGTGQKLFPNNVTFDLIYGRPHQTVNQWQNELRLALECADSHLSLYELTYKRGTPLFKALESGKVERLSDNTLSAMYELSIEASTRAIQSKELCYCPIQVCREYDLYHYEVSNFARCESVPSQIFPRHLVANDPTSADIIRSFRSQGYHNASYWRGADYIGIGPGAHGRITDHHTGQRLRTYRILNPPEWMQQCQSIGHGLRKTQPLTAEEIREELLVFSLRMKEGLSDYRLAQYTTGGQTLLEWLNREQVELFIESEHMELVEAPVFDQCAKDASTAICSSPLLSLSPTLRPTEKGLAVIDSILPRLIQ